MKKNILIALLSIAFFYACNENKKASPATAMEAGTAFIRATLDGDFKVAETLLLKDTENLQLFDLYKTHFEKLPSENKKKYRDASYIINKFQEVNDSVKVINYSNDYMKVPMDIKVVWINKEWKIDLKYTYSGNTAIEQ